MTEMLESGDLQRHILDQLQPAYRSRYRRMLKEIEEHLLPIGVTIPPRPQPDVAGGYFIWLDLPAGVEAKEVGRLALEEENVTLCHGDLFEVYGDEASARFSQAIRLCFSLEDENKFFEGIFRISTVIQRLLEERGDVAVANATSGRAPLGAY
jgi:DNA-binding transcriptional MocR family regulator